MENPRNGQDRRTKSKPTNPRDYTNIRKKGPEEQEEKDGEILKAWVGVGLRFWRVDVESGGDDFTKQVPNTWRLLREQQGREKIDEIFAA